MICIISNIRSILYPFGGIMELSSVGNLQEIGIEMVLNRSATGLTRLVSVTWALCCRKLNYPQDQLLYFYNTPSVKNFDWRYDLKSNRKNLFHKVEWTYWKTVTLVRKKVSWGFLRFFSPSGQKVTNTSSLKLHRNSSLSKYNSKPNAADVNRFWGVLSVKTNLCSLPQKSRTTHLLSR